MDENKENNYNINSTSNNEFNNLDLENISDIRNDNFKSSEFNNNNNSKDINEYFNEDIVPYSPELLDEPIPPSYTRKLISEEIKGNKNIQNKEEVFTFKIKNENNSSNKIGKIKKNIIKYKTTNNMNKNKNTNRIENNDKIKANILTFDELIEKNNNEKLKKKKILKENNDMSENKKKNKKVIKIDFSRKLYQNKTNYGYPEDLKKNKLLKEKTKSEKNFKDKISNIKKKISNNIVINKIKKINNNEKSAYLHNYFKLNNLSNKKQNEKNIKANKEDINERNNKSYVLKDISMEKDNSLIMNKSSRTSKEKSNILKGIKRRKLYNEIHNDNKYKLALKKREYKNSKKRHSEINDELYNFDNSKFEKYDTEQIRYNLIKDYSYTHPENDKNQNNNFLERMKYDSLKRKNKETKLNELFEKNKNKYKLNESERTKTFNRLIDDANRRIIMKQELIENEKYLTDYKELLENSKKYNQEEWEKIYRKRFKDYEDIKKKKLDIQRQNEKIKKMLKEEQEINMCKIKKIPKSKIKLNSERLFNDYKKREIQRNNGLYKNNNICLTNIDEDATKYMKNFKNTEYTFYDDDINNDNNINNLLRNNKSFERKKKLKKNKKISVTEYNNMRFNTGNNNNDLYDYISKNNNKNNIIEPYFSYKRNKVQNRKNDYISSTKFPYEYNYNNYNIYNINNLNNNIHSNNNMNNKINDNNYLDNITYKLMENAALNKINNERINDRRVIQNNLNRNIDFNYNRNLYYNNDRINNNINNNNNYMNRRENIMPQNEGNDLIEQFLSRQFGYQN